MSNTDKSFTPGLRSKLVSNNAVITLWLRDYSSEEKYVEIDTITWDSKTSEHDEVKAFIYDYGIKQVIGDAPSGLDKDIVKTPTNRHEARKAKLLALKEGIIKTKRGKINKEVVGMAKGMKMAGCDKEAALAAFANQPNISQDDIEFSINSVYSD